MTQPKPFPPDNPITIAVVIPAYNAEAYIAQCLESVRAQTRAPDEIIVIDDGSTDRTGELVEKLADRAKLIRKRNGGLAAARNEGFSLTRCRYVAFLDADDYWPPQKLEMYHDYALKHPDVGLFYSDCFCVRSEGAYREVRAGSPGKNPFFHLLKNNFVASSTAMVERDVWERVGGLRGGFSHPAGVVDWDFFLNAVQVKPFHHIPEPLLFYRVHDKSAMQTRLEAMWKDSVRVVLWHSRKENVPLKVKKEALSSIFYQSGLRLLTAGAPLQARQHFCQSLRFSFRSFSSIGLFFVSLAGPRAISFLLALRRHVFRLFILVLKSQDRSARGG
ncbi:MAG: glycosyltransferase [Elusimicrobia bacterium]|nr:glycosyltransferase [Elusimicrobiota bacterium]